MIIMNRNKIRRIINNKKGGTGTAILIVVGILVIAVGALVIKRNWARFKAEASFGFTIAALAVFVIAIVILIIRYKIKKAKKEKEKKAEAERLERERLAAQGIIVPESTIGNGKLEKSDFTEVAGKINDKLDDMVRKD